MKYWKMISFVVVAFLTLETNATKVSRIVIPNKAQTTGAKSQDSLVTLETDEQIEAALRKVKATDVKTFQYLTQIRKTDFDKFRQELKNWLNENNPDYMRDETRNLLDQERILLGELKFLSDSYSSEQDEAKKKSFERSLAEKTGKLVDIQIAQIRVAYKIKKQELDKIATDLFNRERERDAAQRELLKKFMISAPVAPAESAAKKK